MTALSAERLAEIRARVEARPFPLRPFLTHDQVQLLHRLAADVPALLDALGEADAEIERLTAERGEMKRALEALGRERNTWARQMADLRDEKDTADEAAEAARLTKLEVQNERDDLAVEVDELTEAERTLIAERDQARAEVAWWEDRFPCDGLCSDAPEEDCSRHGRKPADLWHLAADYKNQRDKALAERDQARDIAARLEGENAAARGRLASVLAQFDDLILAHENVCFDTEPDRDLQRRVIEVARQFVVTARALGVESDD